MIWNTKVFCDPDPLSEKKEPSALSVVVRHISVSALKGSGVSEINDVVSCAVGFVSSANIQLRSRVYASYPEQSFS